MSAIPYVPSSGIAGKLRRLAAARFARYPMTIRLDRPVVSLTFDDFPRSAAACGKDALERRGWRGTFFAAGCYEGTSTHLGDMYRREDVLRLARDGHEIGCHSFSHLDIGRTPPRAVLGDVGRNAGFLAELGLAGALKVFAYPYGETSPQAKSALAGRFRALRGVQPGINRDGADRARLLAVGIDGGERGIARAAACADQAAGHPGWLVYYAHDLRDDPTPWGCTPAQFERVLDAVADSGAQVLPLGEAFEAIVRAADA